MTSEDFAAPGWDAIDAALARWYGPGEPARHVGYGAPAAFSDNLDGCSAYAAADHWHYVSYGLSELFEPGPDDDPAYSGWGFELTLRVPRVDDQVPGWPFGILNTQARWINHNRKLIAPGHRIDLRRPVTGYPDIPGAPDSTLTVYAVTLDPQLGEITTPNGQVAFLQLVGVSDREKDEMVATSTRTVLDRLAATNPLLITDPARVS